ncbi:P-loop containing nucleoside triphosphate hydrolase protein [Martensiomyces pterosporus]|nr:P-loop containing nucleoside triphosphate hydrolase protein [Martensiomyces pterosporus]
MLRIILRSGIAARKAAAAQTPHGTSSAANSISRVSQSPFSTTQSLFGGGRKTEDKIAEQRNKRDKWAKMKSSRHKMRLEALQSNGRRGGGQSQLLEARIRRARDQKTKHEQAREYVQRTSQSQRERALAEARVLRQRSKQLKRRGTPGLGFTPARFRLLHIENETGTDLTALSCEGGSMRRTKTIKELAEQVASSTFDNIGLRVEVVGAAKQILTEQYQARYPHIKTEPNLRPTEIQALGIPEILGHTRISMRSRKTTSPEASAPGPNVFLAAETGSGKTFAYALPIISQLKQEEIDRSQKIDKIRRERRPRAVVVVPSRELVKQVAATFKSIGHQAKIRTVGIHLGLPRRRLRELVDQGPIDVLVSTPGAILRYMTQDPIFSPADVRRFVIDEADSMMDSHSFGDQTQKLLDLLHKANETQGRKEQAIFVSATLPKLIREQIIYRYPDVVHVTTPSLHRAPQKLSQSFIDVSKEFQGHRLNALWYVLRTAASDKHLIIFCNNKVHANLVHRQLHKRGIPSLLLVGTRPERKAAGTRADRADSSDGQGGMDVTDGQASASGEHISAAQNSRRPAPGADAWEKATWFIGQDEFYGENEESGRTEAAAETDMTDEAEHPATEESTSEAISGADVSDLKAPIPHFDREEVLQAFFGADPIPEHLLPQIAPAKNTKTEDLAQAADLSAKRKILVCTDLASRGLDTTCVSHVVLFDFPTTAIDYLHRTGRTARAGTRGKVTALVGKKDRRLADQIRLAIRQGGAIN